MIKAIIQKTPYCTEMTFPCSEAELSEWLKDLDMNPEHTCPFAIVNHIIEPAELSVLEENEVSLDALNYLGKRLDGMDRKELDQFFAALSCGEDNMEWDLKNIINLTFNLSRYTLIKDTDSLEKIGLTHIMNIRGAILASELEKREWLADEGRKLLDTGKGINTEYGKLFINKEIGFDECYSGGAFPPYCYNANTLADVQISYGGFTELIGLPCENIAIKKALLRLGAESEKDCEFEVDSGGEISDELWEQIRVVEESKDIFGLNALLKDEEIRMKQEQSDAPKMEM
ncbi:MAG: hypothetical protein NC203_07785 [Firmicutes bacterium]|nr:hypothetical protein [[Eubacterium] siraeum]MCM1488250.1 hypothetical protein [Bacillota bacterium]